MNGSWVVTANEIGARTVDSVWRASWQGAIGVAVVLLVCRAWKRIPSSVVCAMWFLVCLKLIVALIPVGIAIPCLPSSSHPPLGVQNRRMAQRGTETVKQKRIFAISSAPLLRASAVKSPLIAAAPTRETLTAKSWLTGFWILGVLFVGAYSTRQLAKSLRLIRKAIPCADRNLIGLAEELRRDLGLRLEPRLLMTDSPTCVLTFGSLRPTVLISAKTLADCTPDEMRMILAHEFAHIRRKDAWLGLIPQVALTLFNFHPLVWLACREFDFAREAACDEEAISCLQIGSDLYGRLLLKLGSRRQTATTLCTPGVSSHFHLLRRRIAMLDKPIEAKHRKNHRRTLVLTCLIGALCIAPLSLVQGQFATSASLKTSSAPIEKSASKKAAKAAPKLAKTAAKQASHVVAKMTHTSANPSMHVFKLKNTDAEGAAVVLRKLLGSDNGGKVVADAKLNTIFVNADEATNAQIASVIKTLDGIDRVESKAQFVPKEPQQVTVYPVQYTGVGSLTNLLHTLYGSPAVAVVKVVADLRTNSIVVTAPENRTREVLELIKKLDVSSDSVPAEKRTITRIIKVRYGDSKQIIPMVMAMMKNEAPQYMSPVLSDNSIIVITTQENCNRVQMLVNVLDTPKSD